MSKETQVQEEEIVLPNPKDFMMGGENDEAEDSPPGEAEEKGEALSEIEQKAHDMGWRPLEEWDGEEAQWVDAKEFVGRQPLYEGLSKQSKELKAMRKMLETLAEQNREIQKNAKKEALEELKAQRVEALRDEDYEKAVELENEYRKVEAEEEGDAQEAAGVSARFEEWREENKWYDDEPDLRIYADAYGARLYAQNPNRPEDELYEEVLKKVKEVFPDSFSKKGKLPNRGNPPGGQGSKAGRASNSRWNLLDADQKRMCREFVEKKVFKNADEYIDSLDAAGMLKKEVQ